MSLTSLLAYVTIAASVGVILRESKDRGSQMMGIATLALGILLAIHAQGRFVRFISRLEDTGTVLSLATLVLGLVLYVRARDKTFAALLAFSGALLLLLHLDVVAALR